MVTSGGAGADLQMLASNQSSFSESAPSARSVGASADYKARALLASVCRQLLSRRLVFCSRMPASAVSFPFPPRPRPLETGSVLREVPFFQPIFPSIYIFVLIAVPQP